ncbi:MAG: MaoC family dehydratase N-terminal domain-containing protein [Chloroflexota bacterium]
MWQALIGARSTPTVNWIERGAVRRFAEAIGDPNPLYRDEDAARLSRYGGLIAPPTFPFTLDYGEIAGLTLPAAGLLHGEQRISAMRPLRVGERIIGQVVLEDSYLKQGGRGPLTFLVFSQTATADSGDVVVSLRQVLIVTEAAMRGMTP